ncbi:Uncharacterised protein [Serratia proteamaculans]|nr:Uncharacterised protein [Serratia proteamaculans]
MWQVVTVERFDDWFLSLNADEQKACWWASLNYRNFALC